MNGKRPISRKTAERITTALSFSGTDRLRFLNGAAFHYLQSRYGGAGPRNPLSEKAQFLKVPKHKETEFLSLSLYSLLGLIETQDFKMDAEWIALRLNVPKKTIRKHLQALLRTGVISKVNGTWTIAKKLTTTQDVPSAALRRAHKEFLIDAHQKLDSVPVQLRDYSWVTMAIDPTKLPEAKAYIRDFRRGLMKILGEGNRTEVYNLNIQLFPLTHLK